MSEAPRKPGRTPKLPAYFDRQDRIRAAEKLSFGERWALACIEHRAGDSNNCWASVDRLASDAGCTARNMIRYLRRLESKGVIRTTKRRGKTNSIAVIWSALPAPAGGDKIDRGDKKRGDRIDRTGGDKIDRGPLSNLSPKHPTNTPLNTPAQAPVGKKARKLTDRAVRNWASKIPREGFGDLDTGSDRFADFTARFAVDWPDQYVARRRFLETWHRTSRKANGNPPQWFATALLAGITSGEWGGDSEDETAVTAFMRRTQNGDHRGLDDLLQTAADSSAVDSDILARAEDAR